MLIGIFNPMGAQSDRLRCEVCQNLFLSPMNTGLLRYAVATVLTVYGIETIIQSLDKSSKTSLLQQCLPFTVLKQGKASRTIADTKVATVLTVYGIETQYVTHSDLELVVLQQCLPFTVLKHS